MACQRPDGSDPVHVSRLRLALTWLCRARATIDADLHGRMAYERDDGDGYHCKQEFHFALLSDLLD
jgi:hypothetical protein